MKETDIAKRRKKCNLFTAKKNYKYRRSSRLEEHTMSADAKGFLTSIRQAFRRLLPNPMQGAVMGNAGALMNRGSAYEERGLQAAELELLFPYTTIHSVIKASQKRGIPKRPTRVVLGTDCGRAGGSSIVNWVIGRAIFAVEKTSARYSIEGQSII